MKKPDLMPISVGLVLLMSLLIVGVAVPTVPAGSVRTLQKVLTARKLVQRKNGFSGGRVGVVGEGVGVVLDFIVDNVNTSVVPAGSV